MTPGELARAARCTPGPITALRRKGLIPLADRPHRHLAAGRGPAGPRKTPGAQSRPRAGVADDPGRHERPAAPDDPDSRRDRQRQDRSLHPGHSRGDPFRAAGDRAGARDQPDAADGRAVSPAVRGGGRFAQPSQRRRAALALAADRRGGGIGGGRRPQRDFRPHAASGADRAWTRSTRLRSSRRARRGITPGTWPSPGPRPKGSRWCSARPRRRWRVGSGRRPAQYTLVEMPRRVLGRPMPAVGTIDLRAQQAHGGLSHGAISRQMHAAVVGRAGGGRPGDFALEPAGLLHPHPVSGLRPRGAMPPVRHRLDAPPHGRDGPLPLLRLRGAGARRRARRAISPASATGDWAPSGWRPRCGRDFPT